MSKGAEIDGDEKTQGMDYSLSSSCRCGRGFAGSGGWLQGPGASRGPCQGGRGAVRGRCPNISGTAAFNQPREERVQLQPKMKNWAPFWPPLSLPLPLPFIFTKAICQIWKLDYCIKSCLRSYLLNKTKQQVYSKTKTTSISCKVFKTGTRQGVGLWPL